MPGRSLPGGGFRQGSRKGEGFRVEVRKGGDRLALRFQDGQAFSGGDDCWDFFTGLDLFLGAQVADGPYLVLHQDKFGNFLLFPAFRGLGLWPFGHDEGFFPTAFRCVTVGVRQGSPFEVRPQFFSHEGRKGMQQAQAGIQDLG